MKSKTFSASALEQSAQLASGLFVKREIDESAETIQEIATRSNTPRKTISERVQKLLADGKLEQVWKHGRTRPVPAYRIKK